MTAQQVVNNLTFREVDGNLEADTRRTMRNERFNLEAAIKSGDASRVKAAKEEALRVAAMWGVVL